jgi:hypothetical protein
MEKILIEGRQAARTHRALRLAMVNQAMGGRRSGPGDQGASIALVAISLGSEERSNNVGALIFPGNNDAAP